MRRVHAQTFPLRGFPLTLQHLTFDQASFCDFFPPENQWVFYQSLRYSGAATAMSVGHDYNWVKIMKTEEFIHVDHLFYI